MTKVAILGAGGTFAMEGAHPYDWVDYGDTGVLHPVETVVERMDLGLEAIELAPVSVRVLPSTGIVPADWCALAARIDDILGEDPTLAGIVVTHGTATLEDTAFFLHLVHRWPQPIIVTGAQRPPNTMASDAPANLRAAVACAADPRLRGFGAFVVMGETLLPAASATKTANFHLDAFEAPEFGPLGRVEADSRLTLACLPASPQTTLFEPPRADTMLPRVDIVYSYPGADGTAIEAFVVAGAAGLVSVGLPPGRCASGERAALLRASRGGLLVVQASRALRGRVPDQKYNQIEGILGGGGLTPSKIRILVMLALASGWSRGEIQARLLAF